MRHHHWILLAVAGLSSAGCSLGASSGSELKTWLPGSWTHDGGAEHWLDVQGELVGLGLTRRDGEIVFYEVLSIGPRGSIGATTYTAIPAGKQAVAFPLTVSEPNRFIAENPTHDFPRKLVYSRHGEALHIDVTGEGARGFVVDLKRTAQPPADALLAADRAFAERVEADGLDAWVDSWHPKGIWWTGEAHVGPQAVRRAATNMFTTNPRPLTWKPDQAVLDGNIGMTVGTWQTPTGASGRYATVWQIHEKSGWKVLFDGSLPLTAPPTPPDETAP